MPSTQDQLRFINESLARIRQHRPAWHEKYSLGPTLPEERIAAFEMEHACQLPHEYREFLMQVGDGGAGPDYGLFCLGQHLPGSGCEDCLEDAVSLSSPFPHSGPWNELPPKDAPDFDEVYFHPSHANGSLIITDRGCALWTRLVITGPFAGEIWLEDRADGGGLHPLLGDDGERLTFLPWYVKWVEQEVDRYGKPSSWKS